MMLRTAPALLLALLLSGVVATYTMAQDLPAAQAAAVVPAEGHGEPDLALMMAFMKPDTIVLKVGEMSLSWHELLPVIKQLAQPDTPRGTEETRSALRTHLQRMALRGLFLQEANVCGVQITEEQRKANNELLEKGLRSNPNGPSIEDVQKAFATEKSSLMALTEEDSQRVVTFGNQLLAKVTINEDEVTQQLMASKAIRDGLAKQNQVTRAKIQDLLKNPESKTDAGFSRLARAHSEGSEAKHGGVLNCNFLPNELAQVNHLDHFDVQPGQTSGLLETPTAFRVMRVLSIIPPQQDGEPERLRVAQWLFRKFPEDEASSREQIRDMLLLTKQQQAVAELGMELQKKYPVSCIFFPAGLWEQVNTND